MQLPSSRDEILILHNPKCSKSRATLALLEESGVEFGKRLYLEHPLGREELLDLGRRLGKAMLAFTRTKQSEFAEAGLTQDSPESAVLDAVVAMPILMERPIVIRGDRAAIGRPPEEVLALLEDQA
jgi:arsenate reductase